jgi:5-formyltetrahydrofolate cyclo-ligase
MEDKNSIRHKMREARKALAFEEKQASDCVINTRLVKRLESLSPSVVAVYLPTADEIDIIPFIRESLARNITVASPRWNGTEYVLSQLLGLEEKFLKTGPMGIREPLEENIVLPSSVDMWIVPGLAFSPNGARIGYGGGWYDRLMSTASPFSHKIAVARSFQIYNHLPEFEKDVPITEIIDDKI